MPGTNLVNSIDFSGQKFYVGLDVHKASWSVTVRSLGMQVGNFTQPPSAYALAKTLNEKFPGGEFYSAYEAGFCGTGHHEQLCKLGINNLIVHAGDIPKTDKERKNKTDVHDSRSIAEHLERKNIQGIHIMPREQQELRSLFRLRETKVKDVTRAINRLKGFLKYYGIEIPKSISVTEAITGKVLGWLDNLEMMTAAGTIVLKDLMASLRYHREQQCSITKLLRKQIQLIHPKAYKRLLSVPGIGSITAIAILAETGDLSRFDDPDDFTSYLGLMPWNDSSGDTIKARGIQPRCNTHLRPLIVEVSWAAIRNSSGLLAYYNRHRVKNNKHAIIKVARKLALIARGVVLNDKDYEEGYYQKQKIQRTSQATEAAQSKHKVFRHSRKAYEQKPGTTNGDTGPGKC